MIAQWLLSTALAARISVDAAGGADFTDLPAAVAAAAPGDYIAVAPGTYSAVAFAGDAVPIVGLGGAAYTWIDDPSASYAVTAGSGELRLEGLTLTGSLDGIGLATGYLRVSDVWILDVGTGISLGPLAWMDAEALLIANTAVGIDSVAVSPAFRLVVDGVTLVDNAWHVNNAADAALTHLIATGGTFSSCAVRIDHALLDDYGASFPSCVTLNSALLGFDPGFLSYTDDGNPFDDDYSLGPGSLGLDRGDTACQDSDGTVCDLGFTGGPAAGRPDGDADGLPDAYEDATGLDAGLADGALDDDGDGLDNLGEYLYDTDPFDADTDGDGEDDLAELQARTDPLDPADNAPTAAATAAAGVVGEPLLLDGSASSDPTNDPLSYRWEILTAPSGSALAGQTSAGVAWSLTPDRVGLYTASLQVDDGHQTATTSLSFGVIRAGEVSIPDEFPTFDEASPYLTDGMTVRFGPGTFAVTGPITQDLSFLGAGADRTTLSNGNAAAALEVSGARVNIAALTLVALQDEDALIVGAGSLVQMNSVRMAAASGAALRADGALVVGWGFEAEAINGVGMELARSQIRLASGRVSCGGATCVRALGSGLRLEGVLVAAPTVGIRVSSTQLRLQHVTVDGAQPAISSGGSVTMSASNLVFSDVDRSFSCTGQEELRLERVLFDDSVMPSTTCVVPAFAQVSQGTIGTGGVPMAGSPALDGGDPWALDPDGTRADLGFTGGRFGLGLGHGLADPEADLDGDGLSALSELVLGSDDGLPDSDSDGIGDLAELTDGDDPAQPFDHIAPAELAEFQRLLPGESATLDLSYGEDPDGEACAFSWDDGASSPRAADTRTPGTQALPWTLRCGEGALHGVLTVLVEDRVPVTPDTLDAALASAGDHTVLELGPGDYTASIATERPIGVLGVGRDTRIHGDWQLLHPATFARDLRLTGDLQMRGSLTAAELRGALTVTGARVESVLVEGGPIDASGASEVRFVTLRGRLEMSDGLALCSATTLEGAFGEAARTFDLIAGDGDFIFADPDPDLAILAPWPRSPLWQACLTEVGPDGPYDIGYTGGPEAWGTDLDLDGMNDAWEALFSAPEPGDDPDGDGLDNLAEFSAGTDPHSVDTDGDGLPDGDDREPRTPNEASVPEAQLVVDDHFPYPGDVVMLDGSLSSDPDGDPLVYTWKVYGPDGAPRHVRSGGDRFELMVDEQGKWTVELEVETARGQRASVQDVLYGRREVILPENADLQAAIDRAEPGDALVLTDNRTNGGVVVDKALVIAHAEGSTRGRLDGTADLAALTVNSARVRVENLALRAEDGSYGVAVISGTLELWRAQVVGGNLAINANNSDVELFNSAVIGSQTLVSAVSSRIRAHNAVMGWVPEGGLLVQLLSRSTMVIQDSILSYDPNAAVIYTPDSEVSVVRSLLSREGSLPWMVNQVELRYGEPAFLLDPSDAEYWLAADLRLLPSSPARDAGDPEVEDPNGTRADMGVFGGPLGDWPDVDNDRDGYANIEGDCADFDRSIFPDPVTLECPQREGCAGCAQTGVGAPVLAWALAALALARRHDRRRAGR